MRETQCLTKPLPYTATAHECEDPVEKKRKRKNIVICCDGTGNKFGGANSNVVKLYTALIIDNDQVGYYHPGVGTMGAPGTKGIKSLWSQVKGLAFAAGFKDNVLDAYRYLMEVYDDGDRVFLFGFSPRFVYDSCAGRNATWLWTAVPGKRGPHPVCLADVYRRGEGAKKKGGKQDHCSG